MKKINIIEAIVDFLASDNAGDAKGVYHPEIVKQHLSDVFNQAVYQTWLNGKKFSDFSQLDAWSRTYPCPVVNQTYALLPFAPMQLPDSMGLRQVCDSADNSNVFAPIEATANVVFAELDVNTIDHTPTYSLVQNDLAIGAGESSHKLVLGKLPTNTLITTVDVMMIVPLSELDDFDEIACPAASEDSMVRQVIDLLSKKPAPDMNNDMFLEKKG